MGTGGILDLNSLGISASCPSWYTSEEEVIVQIRLEACAPHMLETVAKKTPLPALEVAEGGPMVCIREHGAEHRGSS
jgi:hypothetical protein